MLAAEEAKAALTSQRDERWLDATQKRVRKQLKRDDRAIAEAILAPYPAHYTPEAAEAHRAVQLAAATELDQLDPHQLTGLMTALHPEMGAALARWWVAAQAQPYTRGWNRRGFRAPNHPELSRQGRVDDLTSLVNALGPYHQPAEWLAAWAPFLDLADDSFVPPRRFAPLLAAAIDLGGAGGEATLATLLASGNGDHPVGGMGDHVIGALLRANTPEGWAFVESLLLAAQGQEGLRQSILEAADEGHPEAFTRLLDLTIEHNLIRFAATIRAVAVWLGYPEHAEMIEDAAGRLALLRAKRADPAHARQRILDGDAWDTYLGLVSLAHTDAAAAFELARHALAAPDRDTRGAALRFVDNSQLPASWTQPVRIAATADPDLAVAVRASEPLSWVANEHERAQLYEPLDALARRLPETATTAPALGVDPGPVVIDRGKVVTLLVSSVGDRPLAPLLDLVPWMDPMTRAKLMRAAATRDHLDADVRAAVLHMVGDKSPDVRQHAVEAMAKLAIDPGEAPPLEELLTRKAGDLRRGVLTLLSALPPDDARRSAARLWQGTSPQRDAAIELLGTIERTDAVVATANDFLAAGPTDSQRTELDAFLTGDKPTAATDDPTLGLFDFADRTAGTPPVARTSPADKERRFNDPASVAIAEALDDLAETHRDTPFLLTTWQGAMEVLLADAPRLPSPFVANHHLDDGNADMVLSEVFRSWWEERPPECRGESDALDALRARVTAEVCSDHEDNPYAKEQQAKVRHQLRPMLGTDRLQLRHPKVVLHVLDWLVAETADAAVVTECLDATEGALAAVPAEDIRVLGEMGPSWQERANDWRPGFDSYCPWFQLAGRLFTRNPMFFDPDQLARWYGLVRWFIEPVPGAPDLGIDTGLLFAAHAIGVATDADVYGHLIPTPTEYGWGNRQELLRLTRRRRSDVEAKHPTVIPLADRIRERVIELERARGELSTPASPLAFALTSVEGADLTMELLARLGRATLVRGYIWRNEGRAAVYSRLIQISHPAPTDTPEVVAELVKRHRVTDGRLLELAMFAPQWAPLVEQVLGWDGLEDAIWWFHAHTKDDRWSVEAEVRETWAAMSAERTALSADDLTDGAVDVAWFLRVRDQLGPERWAELHKAAKLASGGAGHRRAQIFADAMLGQLDEDELRTRITTKRHQDSVRALGLLPVPGLGAAGSGAGVGAGAGSGSGSGAGSGAGSADEVVLARYQVLQAFERGARQFGQQRQQSERTAVRIAVENLARTTGAADPQRFVWAMEAAEAGDLADGPVTVTEGDLAVTLGIDGEGVPGIEVRRGDKVLKAVPAKEKKSPAVKELLDRRTALKQQATRVRRSLEDAMVRQEPFVEADLVALGRHPVVAPMLDLLVWVDDEGTTFRRRSGAWVGVDGSTVSPAGGTSGGRDAGGGGGAAVRLAHPLDLLHSGHWIDWQARLLEDAERQPFKQAFRELYVLTATEQDDSPWSRRWSGHQLQARQAAALFTARGWLGDRESAQVAKVFHAAGLVARVTFVDGWGTPAEVELPTIDAVCFTKRNDWTPLPLASVPPVVFSEAMRDLDLVVSVAHAGGVDPEASASTVEMRAALVRETARMLKLENVRQESSHVVIEGTLGEYSVHLGSGSVHRRPGGALCIIPVDAQRRGRVFLPFADDDPKTAEVVAKVLLLARDSTIKDPTILEQLRS